MVDWTRNQECQREVQFSTGLHSGSLCLPRRDALPNQMAVVPRPDLSTKFLKTRSWPHDFAVFPASRPPSARTRDWLSANPGISPPKRRSHLRQSAPLSTDYFSMHFFRARDSIFLPFRKFFILRRFAGFVETTYRRIMVHIRLFFVA